MNNLYLKNLAGVRGISSLLVVFHHVEQYKAKFGWGTLWNSNFVREIGGNAVSIFFVLSGFLISYLLLVEKRKSSDINLKKFYFRRILRIWPLYFLALVIGVLANVYFFRSDFQFGDLTYFIFFIANILLAQGVAIPFIAHFWSVCVEEQFYVFWPVITKKFSEKHFLFYMIFLVVAFIIIRNLLLIQNYSFILKLINYSRFDMMAIGSIGAIVFTSSSKICFLIKNMLRVRIIQLIITLILLVFLSSFFTFYKLYFLDQLLFGCFVAAFLMMIVQKESIINFENKLFIFLGNLSYGIYMFHSLTIFLSIKFINIYFMMDNTIMLNVILYSTTLIFTILISYLSFTYFESKFLKIKNKFTTINISHVE